MGRLIIVTTQNAIRTDGCPVRTVVQHRALLYFYTRTCKCQLFTDEGSRRLPKRLNYCFSVLASATNRSIDSACVLC